ncbi:hypothetical protein [Chitinophaga barathri]|nr:hypothetical protein [Chitinophaga barathri]
MLRERDSLIPYYADDLGNYGQVIDSILRTDDPKVKQPLIRFLHDDIAAKCWFPGMGADPNNPLTTVRVKLKVMDSKGDEELRGYTGYLKPQLSNLPKNVTVFIPTFGNEKNISPGIKLVWIEKNGKIIQSRVETLRRTMGTLEIAFLITEQ